MWPDKKQKKTKTGFVLEMQHYMQVFVLPPWRLNSEEGASWTCSKILTKEEKRGGARLLSAPAHVFPARLRRTSISQHRFDVFVFHFPACQSLRRWDTTVWLPVTGWIMFQKVCSWHSDRQARASLKRSDTRLNEKKERKEEKFSGRQEPTGLAVEPGWLQTAAEVFN